VLPFGIRDIDDRLPGGGLPYGALHEIAGGGAGTVDGAAAALFAAGIAARSKGKVLWCLTRPDLFFPAIAQAGLHPDRVIFCEGGKEEDVLASMEEGLSFGGLAAVVGELVRLPMVASGGCTWLPKKPGPWGLLSAGGDVLRRYEKQWIRPV
jgi:protein ImuA